MGNQYPSDWTTRRKTVYDRDDYTCQHCGAGGGKHEDAELHAHHIVPLSKGGNNEYSNLTTLCSTCHSAVHGRPLGETSSQQPSKWGKWWMHGIIFICTLGLGTIPYALYKRFKYAAHKHDTLIRKTQGVSGLLRIVIEEGTVLLLKKKYGDGK